MPKTQKDFLLKQNSVKQYHFEKQLFDNTIQIQ